MRRAIWSLGMLLVGAFSIAFAISNTAKEKPQDSQTGPEEYRISKEDIDKKNPVTPTPEGLAAGKKLFGLDCSMCHGLKGDGTGELVASMQLKMNNWGDPASFTGKTDGEIFYIITKGKGKMPGENERLSATKRWDLVNYVRSLAKKSAADKS